MKGFALTLKFSCEVVALFALFWWGVTTGPVVISVFLAIAAPAAATLFWRRFCAPTASERLDNPYLMMAETGVFAIAAIALAIAVSPVIGFIFAIVIVMNTWLLWSLGLSEA